MDDEAPHDNRLESPAFFYMSSLTLPLTIKTILF